MNVAVSALIGKFYEGDCYIILQTFINEQLNLDWKIWYWIGEKATVSFAFISSVPHLMFLGRAAESGASCLSHPAIVVTSNRQLCRAQPRIFATWSKPSDVTTMRDCGKLLN